MLGIPSITLLLNIHKISVKTKKFGLSQILITMQLQTFHLDPAQPVVKGSYSVMSILFAGTLNQRQTLLTQSFKALVIFFQGLRSLSWPPFKRRVEIAS